MRNSSMWMTTLKAASICLPALRSWQRNDNTRRHHPMMVRRLRIRLLRKGEGPMTRNKTKRGRATSTTMTTMTKAAPPTTGATAVAAKAAVTKHPHRSHTQIRCLLRKGEIPMTRHHTQRGWATTTTTTMTTAAAPSLAAARLSPKKVCISPARPLTLRLQTQRKPLTRL